MSPAEAPEPQSSAPPMEHVPTAQSSTGDNAVEPATGAVVNPRQGRQIPIVVLPLLLLIGGGVYVALTQTEMGRSVLLGRHPQRPRRRGHVVPGNGFDLKNATIPKAEILGGGPPKDGIPAITRPKFVAGRKAKYLKKSDRVIGVVIDGKARAYPLRILNYHEAVNDRIGKIAFAVTYCPLCDSAVVFDRRGPDGVMEFGVSGLLYNSNVLLYDRQKKGTESLWSQVMARGVTGPAAKRSADVLPVELTTWADWLGRYSDSKVLSTDTGYRRNYSRSPYGGYFKSDRLMFPVSKSDKRLKNKVRVLGVWTDRAARAYPVTEFRKSASPHELDQVLDGHAFSLSYNPQAGSLRVVKADKGLRVLYAFWFAWYAFHPETELYRAAER